MDSGTLRDSLLRLALNHSWTWSPDSRDLWASLDGGTFHRHPVQTVSAISPNRYDELLADGQFMTTLADRLDALDVMLDGRAETSQIAYFCAEFGISEMIHQYAGGLGILAGDHLKASSDLNIPLVGVGLFYRHGFFRQHVDEGHQTEEYRTLEPESSGAVDTDIIVTVPMPGRAVAARVWQTDVGRTPLILLDTEVAGNSEADRSITDRLYGGDRRHRLEQEMVLGVGGARALAALGRDVSVHHLNEGHAGFLALELIDRLIVDGDLDAAVSAVRHGLVFTTHTPVSAGIDRFERRLIAPYLAIWASRWGIEPDELWALGAEPRRRRFNMAALSLRVSSSANGVSKLHGNVSRDLFAGIGIGDDIFSITNGVHARSWVAPHFQAVFDEVLGPAWSDGDPDAWAGVEQFDDSTVTALRRTGSVHLATLVADRVGQVIDPDSLVVGFARRFVPYKRATLLFHHLDRLAALLADDQRPLHFVFAGKAHPADSPGKDLVAEILDYSVSASANGRFTFIPDYDFAVARAMYEGCDLWLNTPVRPREASGTSGEKAALNGGLNCSILDGWWDEMYHSDFGWSIPTSDNPSEPERDREDSAATLDTLECVIDEYYQRRDEFIRRIRRSWIVLGPRVVAARMLGEYHDRVYGPALDRTHRAAQHAIEGRGLGGP